MDNDGISLNVIELDLIQPIKTTHFNSFGQSPSHMQLD